MVPSSIDGSVPNPAGLCTFAHRARGSAAHKKNMTVITTATELESHTLATITDIDPGAEVFFARTHGSNSITVVPSLTFLACDTYALTTAVREYETAANM